MGTQTWRIEREKVDDQLESQKEKNTENETLYLYFKDNM